MASSGVLISAVLLVFYIAVSSGHESDLIVLTTADRLREELKECIDTGVKEAIIDIFSTCPIPGLIARCPASSCREILELAPSSPTGYYWMKTTDDPVRLMYCDMELKIKGVGGGWMRVASINMSDPADKCPIGLKTLENPFGSSKTVCAIENYYAGCSSAFFPMHGIEYSKVSGRIIGYQIESTDAFNPFISHGQTTIDSYYVEGISLTHGSNPRKHIWTFVSALHEDDSGPSIYVCPCTDTRRVPAPVPPFIGQDYFCDTGSEDSFQYGVIYTNDPLWDGAGCGTNSTCCDFNSPPWFLKRISPTCEDIEIRLCSDQTRDNEDVAFEILELYVQ